MCCRADALRAHLIGIAALQGRYLWRDSKSKEAPGLRALMADSTVRSPAAEHARPWLTAKAEFEKLLPFALSSCEQAWVAV